MLKMCGFYQKNNEKSFKREVIMLTCVLIITLESKEEF